MDNIKEVDITKTHVPDKLYGYGLQVRQMLYELLNCEEGDIVSVEKFDDVGVEEGNGEKTAIQTKSALSDRNPVSNKASDLWKTLFNWINAVGIGELDITKTKFTLVINVDKHGAVVDSFNAANDARQAKEAYLLAKQVFFDKDGKYILQNESIDEYVKTFFNESNSEIAVKIIEKFNLVTMTETHTEMILKEFKC